VRTRYVLAVLTAAVGFVAGCGNVGQKAGAPPSAGSAAIPSPHTASAVPKELDFTAKTVDGSDFSGASLAGKPAVLWFWAPWCPVCQGEAPDIAEAAHDHPRVTFVGVAALDQLPAMQSFANKYGVGVFTNIADVSGAVWQRFGVTAQPAFAFVGADGAVEVVRRSVSEPELGTRVSALANT
jgi:thiol-disulfide isomerase/thioredoxin